MPVSRSEITRLLKAWSDGDTDARDQLMPLVIDELRRIARYQLERENAGHTLQPTAIVNELYLKLVDQRSVQWNNRQDFFAIAATLIRRVLVDHARKRRAGKRWSGEVKINFDEALGLPARRDPSLIALDDAMKGLEKIDPRGSRVVELHVFAGLEFEEIAKVLAISRSTVIRDWNHARLWLRRELTRE
jgi:RNA polymerase sigma factor (TIGR02999 family)